VRAASPRRTGRLGVAECFDLRFGLDLGVSVCRGEVGVPEPAADDVHLDAGLQQMDCGGVPLMCNFT